MSVPHPLPPVPTAGGPSGPEPGAAGRTALGLTGIVVLVAGTFLPWIRSGRINRNSYEIVGVGLRRLDLAAPVEGALQLWRFVGPLWAVVVVLMIAGRPRSAAVATLILAAITCLVAVGGLALVVGLDATVVRGVPLGPTVTLVGSAAAAAAAVATLRRRSSTGAPAGAGPAVDTR